MCVQRRGRSGFISCRSQGPLGLDGGAGRAIHFRTTNGGASDSRTSYEVRALKEGKGGAQRFRYGYGSIGDKLSSLGAT
jgi:hypothetical protein